MQEKTIQIIKKGELNISAIPKAEEKYFYRVLFESLLKIKQNQAVKNI